VFFGPKDGNTMLHQFLCNRHVATFSKSKKKGLLWGSVEREGLHWNNEAIFMERKVDET